MTTTCNPQPIARKWKITFSEHEALVFLFLLIPAFDFKGEEGGTMFQSTLTALTLALGIAVAIHGKSWICLLEKKSHHLKLWAASIAASTAPLVYFNIDVIRYIKTLTPFALFFIGLLISQNYLRVHKNPERIFFICFFSLFLSTLWAPIAAIFFMGIEINSARYQILSTGLPAIIAFSVSLMFFKSGAQKIIGITISLLLLLSIVTSVTRSSLMLFILAILFSSYIKIRAEGFLRGFAYKLAPAAMLSLIAIIAAPLLRPEIFSTWMIRLSKETSDSGEQINLLTRIAEVNSQISLVNSNLFSTLLGRGLGSTYSWDYNLFSDISKYYPMDYLISHEPWYAGHVMPSYFIFSFGWIFGSLLIGSILIITIKSFKTILKRDSAAPASSDLYLRASISIATILFLVNSLFSNPFGSRYAALIYGVVFGLANQLQKRNKPIKRSPQNS